MNDKLQQLYNLYKSKGLINTTDFNTFASANSQQIQQLYNLGKKNGLFNTTDLNTFSSAFSPQQKWRQVTEKESAGRLNYRKDDFRTWDIVEETQKGMTKEERKKTGFDYTPEQIAAGKKAVAMEEAPVIEYSDLKLRRGKDGVFYKVEGNNWYEVAFPRDMSKNIINESVVSLEGSDLYKINDPKKVESLNIEFGEKVKLPNAGFDTDQKLIKSGIDTKIPSVLNKAVKPEDDPYDVFGGWDDNTRGLRFRKDDYSNVWLQIKPGVDSGWSVVTETMAKELNKRYGGKYGSVPKQAENLTDYQILNKTYGQEGGSGVLKRELLPDGEPTFGLPKSVENAGWFQTLYPQTMMGQVVNAQEARRRGMTSFDDKVHRFVSNNNIARLEEEEAVKMLTNEFGRYGFEFIESGVNDEMIVRTKDGLREVVINLDTDDLGENIRLQDFLIVNMDPSAYEAGDQKYAELINRDRRLIYSNNGSNSASLYKDLKELFNDEDYKIWAQNLPYGELEQEVNYRIGEYRSLMNKPGVNSSEVFKDMETFKKSPMYQQYQKNKKEAFELERMKMQSLYDEVRLDPGQNSRARQKVRMFLSDKYLDKAKTEYNAMLNDINQSAKFLKTRYDEYHNELQKLNTSNLTPEQIRVKKEQLDKMALQLDVDRSNLIRRQKAVTTEAKQLEYLTGKYVVDVAKEGGFIGGLMNSFSDGISKMIKTGDVVGRLQAETKGSQIADNMTEEEKRYYKTKGYSLEEIKIAEANKAWKESKEDLSNRMKSAIGDLATTKQYQQSEDRGIVSKALFGLAESLPAMATSFINPYVGFGSLSAQAYSSLEDEMLNDPDFETTSLTEMNLIALPYAMAMGALEKIGLSSAMSKNPLAKSLIMKSIQGAVKKTTGKGSAELLQNVLDKEIKSNMAKFGIRIVGGALTEAETGATQSLVLDIGYKSLINEIKKDDRLASELTGGEFFDTPDSFMDGLKMVIEDGIAEGIGGMVMSGFGSMSQKVINGNISLYDNEDVDFLKTVSTDNELRKMIVIKLKSDMLTGKITKSEAEKQLNALDKVGAIFNAMPDNLSVEDQVKSVNLMSEKQRLEKEIDGKDQSLVAAQKERITEIDNELQKISKDAFQKQATGEVPVQPEARVGEEVEGRKPETKLEEVTKKGQEGVVQTQVPRKKGWQNSVVKKEESTTPSGDKVTTYKAYAVNENGKETNMGTGILTTIGEIAPLVKGTEGELMFYDEDGNLKEDPNAELYITKTIEGTNQDGSYQQRVTVVAKGDLEFNGRIQADFTTNKNVVVGESSYKSNLTTKQQQEVTIDKPVIATNTTAELDRVKSVDMETEDGATFNIDGTKYEGGGLVVPIVSENTTVEEITPEMISDFVEKHSSKIGDQNTVKVGIYKFPNSNKVSIDLNIVAPESSRQQAIEFAKAADQESLFDLSTFENVKTGGTGVNPTQFTDEQFKEIAKALNEGRTPSFAAPTQQNLVTLENVEEVADKRTATAIKLVLNALPDVKIYIHKTNEEYSAAIGEEAEAGDRGAYDTQEGAIHINLAAGGNAQTVFHEAIHHALLKKGMDSGAILDLANGLNRIITDKKLKKRLSDFISQYETSDQAEEYLSELGAIMAEAEIELTTTKFNQFKALIARIFQKLGLPKSMVPFLNAMNSENAVDFINSLTKSLRTGENIMTDGFQSTINPTNKIKKQVEVKEGYKLSYVKQSDIIDIQSLISDIASNDQNVWFWVADQLGRGFVEDDVIDGKHYLDAGPSFALDPKNRERGIIWASGANPRTLQNNINKSDYIFIISGSPQKSKLFNKTVSNLVRSRIEKSVDFDTFKKSLIEANAPKDITSILEKYNSYDDLFNGPDRKAFLIAIGNQANKKATKSKQLLESYNAFVDYDSLRDDFYRENGFEMGDIMLVLKPTGVGEKSDHSTYENNILGEVVGVPDSIINSYDILPEETRNKYKEDISRVQQQQVVAPYGMGVSKVKKHKGEKITAPVAGNKLFNEPLKDAENIARSYMQSIGMEYVPVEKITKLDEDLSKRISDAYDQMENNPNDPKVKAAYEAMAKETLDQYDAIVKEGYNVEINNNEPYSNSEAMIKDLKDNKRMKIFSTESGFGDEPITEEQRSENLLLKDSGRKDVNGETLLINDVFRFVHDFFGHAKLGNSFGPVGEENAWRVHSEMYSPEARKAMTSETRGQNSWVNFSGVNDAAFKKRDKARELRKEGKTEEADRLVGEVYEEMKFADQKVGILPDFAIEEGTRFKKQKDNTGYRSGDLIKKAETKDKFEGSDRSTGHFGTGFYFFGTKNQADQYGERATSTIDLDGYNLAKGTIELHDLLKDINNNSIGKNKNIDKLKSRIENLLNYLGKSEVTKLSRDYSELEFKSYVQSEINQKNKIESIINEINNNNVDSPSTVVMKSLGFDGVDSRGTDLDNAQYGSVVYSIKQFKKQKPTSKQEAIQKAKDKYELSVEKRGNSHEQGVAAALGDLQKSNWFANADDTAREDAVREIKAFFGEKIKKAPSVAKILGKPKPETQTKTVDALRKEFFTAWNKASREAKADLNSKRKAIGAIIKSMVRSGKITTKQAAVITDRASSINLENPVIVQRFLDYVSKVFADANYQEKLSNAFSTRKAIRRLTKSNNQAEVIGMAKAFLNIDPSMVEDIDTYNEIAESIKNAMAPSVVRGEQVKFKQPANIADVNEYTMEELSKQEEIKKDQLLAEYDYLKDAGLISKDMTLNEIRKIIEDMKSTDTDINDDVKDFVERRLDMMLGIVESIIRTGVNPITGEPMEISDKNKDILKAIMKMDLKELDTRSLIYLSESVDNFLNNGITSGLEANVQSYVGAMKVKALVNAGVKSVGIKTKASKIASTEILSIPLLFEKLFRGTTIGTRIMSDMGLLDMVNGKNKAELIYNKILESYTKQDFYGKDFMTQQNIIERGMLAYLMRNVNGDNAQVKAELNRRIDAISESIKQLKEGNSDEQKLAEMYENAFSKLKVNSRDIDIIRANSSKSNREAVDWWVDQWKQHYTDLYDVSLSVYNTMLSSDINYTPDKMKLMSSKSQDDDITSSDSGFVSSLGYTDTKKAGVLMENVRKKPKNRYVDLNFDMNNANSLRNALVDINTAAAIRQVKGFMDSNNFDKLAGDESSLIKSRVNSYVKRMKGKRMIPRSSADDIMKYFNAIAKAGTIRALGGVGSAIKQFSPVINTLLNAGRFTSLTPNSNAWIDRLGMPISNRGIKSEANIDTIDKRVNVLADSAVGKVYDGVGKIGDMWLKALIQSPDAYVARSSFITYYLKSLRDQGLSTKIDWNNHEVNKKAAEYAQMQVDRQQNVSDPLLTGELFATEDATKKMITKLFMPFTSFVWNQRARMINDMQILGSKVSSKEDKIIAMRSLAALPAEIVVFNLLGAAIRKTIDAITNYFYGEDDDEEEEVLFYVFGMKVTEDDVKEFKMPIKNLLVDLFSPLPGLTDEFLVTGFNNLFEMYPLVGDDEIAELVKAENDMRIANGDKVMTEKQEAEFIEEEKKKRTFQLYENMESTGWERYIPGAPGVALKTYSELKDAIDLAMTGKYEDEYQGRKSTKYISEEDRKKVAYGLFFQIPQALGLLPREAGQIPNKGIRNIKKRSYTENQKTKMEEVEKLTNRPIGKIEKVLISKNSDPKKIAMEMKMIDKLGGFDEKQEAEYAKLRRSISKPNIRFAQMIKGGMTAEDIIRRIAEIRKR